MPNRLAHETSPYLLQHASNPVDWYPWGEEALRAGQATSRSRSFLSIGYSACHWCHVMEHESFENAAIAASLNEHFVCIKVDREERPDLDQIYMQAVQAMTGRGGWPMSVFLTPEMQPFFGGTYWPPTARMGMPGFDQVIEAVSEAWQRAARRRCTNSPAAHAITWASGGGPGRHRSAAQQRVCLGEPALRARRRRAGARVRSSARRVWLGAEVSASDGSATAAAQCGAARAATACWRW